MPLQPLRTAVVTAPSRLHFGMFSFGRPDVRQFGGVGVMIGSPAVRVSIHPAETFTVMGMHAGRARRFAQQVVANLRQNAILPDDDPELNLLLDVEQAPREHIGLGVGTQLGLSIAAAICAAFDIPRASAVELARLAGRGARSAIGTHGFDRGGLLLEAGKYTTDEISPLVARLDLAADWRFLLMVPRTESGMAGADEKQAFERLPAVSATTTDSLLREAILYLLPAAATRDFGELSTSLYRFGHLAGSCFAGEQGGPFAGERTARLVERLRQFGIQGVGQSSWGPTVFALCESESDARDLLRKMQSTADADDYECLISAAANGGARIEVVHE